MMAIHISLTFSYEIHDFWEMIHKQINDITGELRGAAQFVKSCYDHTPGSMDELHWRRKEARLTICTKLLMER